VAGSCEHGNKYSGSIKDGAGRTVSFSGKTFLHAVTYLICLKT
jgi:hypothetical protein